MKKIERLTGLCIILSMIMSFFTGCTVDEKTVYNAFDKLEKAPSMESKTDIQLSFETTGLSDEEKEAFQFITPLLNDLHMQINQKTVRDKQKDLTRNQVDEKIELGGLGLSVSSWVDTKLSDDTQSVKEIVKLPLIYTLAMPEELRGKPYMVLDTDHLPVNDQEPTVNFKEIMESSQNLNSKLTKFLDQYVLELNPGFGIITKQDNKSLSDKSSQAYQLKLDDSSFKSLAKYVLNDFVKNEEGQDLIREYMLLYAEISASSGGIAASAIDIETAKKEAETNFKIFKLGLPLFVNQMNKVIDSLQPIKLIGDKGIVIDYTVNKDGFVTNEKGVIDTIIDMGAITRITDQISGSGINADSTVTQGIFKACLRFNTDYSNINGNVNIDLPELTKENSFALSDMMKQLNPTSSYQYNPGKEYGDPWIWVYVNNNLIYMDTPPIMLDDRVLVPARETFEAIGAEVTWDDEKQSITVTQNDTQIVLTVDSMEAYVNGEPIALDVPATMQGNKVFIPVRFISESVGAHVSWNENAHTVKITTED